MTSDGHAKGSEFVVELPHIEPTDGPQGASAPAAFVSRRVLVIEDDRDSAESMKTVLELFGHRVDVAHSGPEGVRALATLPEVVVCDIGLPGMSGHAVCAALRARPEFAGTLFLALSGHAEEGAEADAQSFDLHLLKPVDPVRLSEVIAAAHASASPGRSAVRPEPACAAVPRGRRGALPSRAASRNGGRSPPRP